MDYAVATIHMQGFTRIFRPENFAPSTGDHDAVKARGREIFEKGLALLDKQMAGKEYVAGAFSIADAALFYVEFWASARLKMELPPNLKAHYQRMLARPAVQRVFEGRGAAGLMALTNVPFCVSASWGDGWNARNLSQGNVDVPLKSEWAGAGSVGGGAAEGAGGSRRSWPRRWGGRV